MQLLGLIALNPFGQTSWVMQMRTCLQTFLEFGDAPLDRVKHLVRLVTGIAEHQDPPIFTQFLAYGLCV